MHDPDDLTHAVKRMSSGATVGMVEAALKEKGVGSGPRDEILEKATRIVNRSDRIKHGLVAIAGLLIFVIGGIWIIACIEQRIHRVSIPGAITGFGLLATIYGAYSMTQNRVKRRSANS